MDATFKDWQTLRTRGVTLRAENDGEEKLLRLILESLAVGGTVAAETEENFTELEFDGDKSAK